MALLTHAYDPNAQTAWLANILREADRQRQAQSEAAARITAAAQATLQASRRAYEFEQKQEFDYFQEQQRNHRAEVLAAEDKRRWEFENAPINLGGGTATPAESVASIPVNTSPAPRPGNFSASTSPAPGGFSINATEPSIPSVETPAIPSTVPTVANTMNTGDTFTPPTEPTGAGASGDLDLPVKTDPPTAIPGLDAVTNTPLNPEAPAPVTRQQAQSANSPAAQVLQTYRELQGAGMPVNRKMVQSTLPNMLASAFSAQNKRTAATSAATESQIKSWPINDKGYRFNPEAPEQQFMERHTPKGSTFTQVKPTDNGYGLKPTGEGIFEDANGGQYFVEEVRKGQPVYKRVEEDNKVSYRATDKNTGKIVSYNRFGREVGVTDERFSFMDQKTKPMVGSDGNVYPYDTRNSKFIVQPPQGVTFDGGRNEEARRFQVGNDGKMYAFKRDGTPLTPLPDGVRFDKTPDPEKVTKWEVDEKTGDLHGFNYKGDKIAANEGDYAKIAKSAEARQKEATLSDLATYEAVAPTVRGYWQVMDQIREAGLDPHADHNTLVQSLGERGRQLSMNRQRAQQAVDTLKIRGRRMGRDFAEGYVRAFEARTLAKSGATAPTTATPAPTAPPSAAPAPAPGSAPAPAPAASPAPATTQAPAPAQNRKTIWIQKDGFKWEFYEDDKKPTGRYVKV